MRTEDEIAEEMALEIDELLGEAEFELERDLTDEERASIIDEYLADLEDDDDAPAMEAAAVTIIDTEVMRDEQGEILRTRKTITTTSPHDEIVEEEN